MGKVFEDMKKEFIESLTVEQKRNLFVWCDEKIKNRDASIREDVVNRQKSGSNSVPS